MMDGHQTKLIKTTNQFSLSPVPDNEIPLEGSKIKIAAQCKRKTTPQQLAQLHDLKDGQINNVYMEIPINPSEELLQKQEDQDRSQKIFKKKKFLEDDDSAVCDHLNKLRIYDDNKEQRKVQVKETNFMQLRTIQEYKCLNDFSEENSKESESDIFYQANDEQPQEINIEENRKEIVPEPSLLKLQQIENFVYDIGETYEQNTYLQKILAQLELSRQRNIEEIKRSQMIKLKKVLIPKGRKFPMLKKPITKRTLYFGRTTL